MPSLPSFRSLLAPLHKIQDLRRERRMRIAQVARRQARADLHMRAQDFNERLRLKDRLEPNTMIIRGEGEGAPPHAEHLTYLFSVRAMCVAPNAEDWGEYGQIEDHAVIYTDGRIALTLYEYCYAMFSLPDGYVMRGDLHKENTFRLTSAALERLDSFNKARKGRDQ